MKTIKEIAPQSILIYAGCIGPENDYNKVLYMEQCNRTVNKSFGDKTFFILNYFDGYKEEADRILTALGKLGYYGVIDEPNYGYQLGFLHLDSIANDYAYWRAVDRYVKCNIDVSLEPTFLNLAIDDTVDFHYLPGVSAIFKELYSPSLYQRWKQQVLSRSDWSNLCLNNWLYILKRLVTPWISDRFIEDEYVKWQHQGCPNQNNILASEDIHRTLLLEHTKQCLMSETQFDHYVSFVKHVNMGDASAKNVRFTDFGITHWHWRNAPIVPLCGVGSLPY